MLGHPPLECGFIEPQPLAYGACTGIGLSPVHLRLSNSEPATVTRVGEPWLA
jgi:hypothetical protein